MREFFFSARIFKKLGSSENEITAQLETLERMIQKISQIDPIFAKWYVNNSDENTTKAPLDYPFPSEKAQKFLFKLRKEDEFESFSLWNGLEERINFASFNFDNFGLVMTFKKVLSDEQMVLLFKALLENLNFQYIYINDGFFKKINIFQHRLPTTSICYVPLEVAADYLPHLYKKVDIDNQFNKGTILVFDENWADESDNLKKIVQENSIALIELGAIPEKELPEGFFNE